LTEQTTYDESKLLLAVAEGDEQAFSQLYYHYQEDLYHFIFRLVKVPALTEDILQDIFLKIWEARGQLPHVRNFGGYLFSVARNHTLNILQSISKSTYALSTLVRHFQELRVDDEALSKDYLKFVHQALQSIPSRSRDIFQKCRELGMSYEQVASEMGISKNAVKKHMMTAIRGLKDAAQKDLGFSLEAMLGVVALLSAVHR
jgi:RNA polymerase sigma-70 factor (family 1)